MTRQVLSIGRTSVALPAGMEEGRQASCSWRLILSTLAPLLLTTVRPEDRGLSFQDASLLRRYRRTLVRLLLVMYASYKPARGAINWG